MLSIPTPRLLGVGEGLRGVEVWYLLSMLSTRLQLMGEYPQHNGLFISEQINKYVQNEMLPACDIQNHWLITRSNSFLYCAAQRQ